MLAASFDTVDWMAWTLVRVALSLIIQLYSSNMWTAQPIFPTRQFLIWNSEAEIQ